MLVLQDVSLSYQVGEPHGDAAPVAGQGVSDISLRVAPGELVALVGKNGAGKSTISSLLCGAVLPDAGTVRVDGLDPQEPEERLEVRKRVGRVLQAPEDQIVSTVVADEVAFGPRNLGLDDVKVSKRVSCSLAAVGLAGAEEAEVHALSGGEQQRLACAAVLAMDPSYLVLDEVTAQLDSTLRPGFRRLFRALARERGMGIVLVTHDVLELALCDRAVVIEAGCVAWSGSPADLLLGRARSQGLFERTLPTGPYAQALQTALKAGYSLEAGAEPEDMASWLSGASEGARAQMAACVQKRERATEDADARRGIDARDGDRALVLDDVSYCYRGRDAAPVEAVHGVSLRVEPGTITLLAGSSGAGKTTLACLAAGLLEPSAGSVSVGGVRPCPGDVCIAFQQPEQQLFLESVAAELAFGPGNLGCDAQEVERRVARATRALDLERLLDRDPFSLSGGQARRVALGSVLTLEPRALVLDEPTAGLDAPGRAALHALVCDLARQGLPILVVSHDLEEWLEIADAVALLRQGELAWTGSVAALRRDQAAFDRAGLMPPESWRLASLLEEDRRADQRSAGAVRESTTASPVFRSRPARDANVLETIDARVKIALLLVFTVAIFAGSSPAALAAWVCVALAAIVMARTDLRRLAAMCRPLLVLFVFMMAANLVSCDGTAQIPLVAQVGLAPDRALRTIAAVVRIAVLVCLAFAVSATTTPPALANACVRLLHPLRRFGAPVEELGLTISLALRFIPLVAQELERIHLAQRSRGVDFERGTIVERIRVWASVLTPLVVSLFRRADRIAASMDARCYAGASGAQVAPEPLDARSRLTLSGGLVLAAALVALGFAG